MALLLFVRSIDDVMPAVEGASEFLAYRKRPLEGSRESDDPLGILIDPDLDAALPAWFIPSLHSPRESPTPIPFSLRYSVSLSDIWTLCWIDLFPSESELGRESRREALIATLAKMFSDRYSSIGVGLLIPVFGPGVAVEHIEATMADLKARYPSIIGTTWFVHDRNQGKVVPAERAEGLRH